MSNVKEMAVVL